VSVSESMLMLLDEAACEGGRTDAALWDKSKKKAIAKMGGRFSARAMQLAGKLYRDAGGGYCGKKTKAQKSMSKWSDEDWTTADGKPAKRKVDGKVVYDRYLPKKAWRKLSKTQREATRRKKREGRQQFVANTKKAAAARSAAQKEAMSVTAKMEILLAEKIQSPSTPKGKAAYIKSLTSWSKAASKVAQSYSDKLGDFKEAQGSMSGAALVGSIDKLLSNVSDELAQIAAQIEKLK
jgi:hypothetical protein